MKKILCLLIAMFTMAVSSAPLHAEDQLININFGEGYSGGAVTGAAGDEWNEFISKKDKTNLDLENSEGESTTVKLSYTTDGYDTFNDGAFQSTDYQYLMDAGFYSDTEGTKSFTLSGLDPNTPYTVYVYTQGKKDGVDYGLLNLTVNGSSLVQSSIDTNLSTFQPGVNYLTGTYNADPSGKIVITYWATGAAQDKAMLNGVQVFGSANPEPASMVLLGIGGALAAAKLRRKKAGEASSAAAA